MTFCGLREFGKLMDCTIVVQMYFFLKFGMDCTKVVLLYYFLKAYLFLPLPIVTKVRELINILFFIISYLQSFIIIIL